MVHLVFELQASQTPNHYEATILKNTAIFGP